ncbi:MAG: molybdate transport system permease protein [Gammaproteobacteria bacterium]|jgi:molybdate transport system permease protein
MDWQAFKLSFSLAFYTCLFLIPTGIFVARIIAWRQFAGRSLLQALLALPLILPPTVLGFYLLTLMGNRSPIGQSYEALVGNSLVFSFEGILIASIIFNIPFAIQPIQRAFESIPHTIREAAWTCGLTNWSTFLKIELPLAWPGILTSFILTFAHTLGEFGVVLMVGGNIEGETRTIAISIYDRVQAFDNNSAAIMSASLLIISFVSIAFIYVFNNKLIRHYES